MIKTSEVMKGRCQFFHVFERLSMCNIIDKPLRKLSSLFSSSMKDDFIINALNCNVLYFVQ